MLGILKKLLKFLPKINISKEWLLYCKKVRRKYPIVLDKFRKQKKYLNSYDFVDNLSDVLKNEVIVTDMGLSFVGTHQAFKIKKVKKLFTDSGCTNGMGFTTAIGVIMHLKIKELYVWWAKVVCK